MRRSKKRSFQEAAAAAGIPDLDVFLQKQRARLTILCRKKLPGTGEFHDQQAADTVQDVLRKFVEHIEDAALQANPGGWLTTAAKNECATVRRGVSERLFGTRPKPQAALPLDEGEINEDSQPTSPPATCRSAAELSQGARDEEDAFDPFEAAMDDHAFALLRQLPAVPYTWFEDSVEGLEDLTAAERAAFLLRESSLYLNPACLEELLDKKTARVVLKAKERWLQDHASPESDQRPPNMPVKEIARHLHMPLGTVRSHLTRAKQKLLERFHSVRRRGIGR